MAQTDEEGFSRLAENREGGGYKFNRVTFRVFPEYDELHTKGGTTSVAGKSQEYIDAVLAAGGSIFEDSKDGQMLRVRAAGHPVFRNVDYINIQTPGDKTNVIDRPATDEDKRRYAKQYAAYKANSSQDEASGTLLSAWGMVEPARIEEYAFFGVRTVEQLSGMSDSNLQRMGPGAMKDRTRAKDYLKAMEGHAPVVELRTENEALRARMEAQEATLRDQAAAIAELRRGRAVDSAFAAVGAAPQPATEQSQMQPFAPPPQDEKKRARK